uniref:14_3_3 domain-containing protein n=1 Tax=Panagrellus redivivus TaxID=6233 RepID=A0A7E4ZUV1_PANRE
MALFILTKFDAGTRKSGVCDVGNDLFLKGVPKLSEAVSPESATYRLQYCRAELTYGYLTYLTQNIFKCKNRGRPFSPYSVAG